MNTALPDYRERLGGAIQDVSAFTFKALDNRLSEVFPGGYVKPRRIGQVVVPFVIGTSKLKAHPVLAVYRTIDGVPQDTDLPKHSSISTEIRESGARVLMLHALYGYIWQNVSDSPKPYTMALTTHNFTEDEQIEALSRITAPGEFLHDHTVYAVTEPNWQSSTTVHIQDGRAVDVTPASLPSHFYEAYSARA
jgi:hypothetical protein